MSKIIYLKDILLEKANKKIGKRTKLKPFKQEPHLKSSLVDKKIQKDEKQHR